MSSHSITFNLPCDDGIWDLDDQAFTERLSVLLDNRISFRKALHILLTSTPAAACNLQSLSSFGKEILVCAVLETMTNAKTSPLSYSSFDDYQDGNLATLNVKDPLFKAMGFCRMLWPAQLHDYYSKSATSHPDIESTVLLLFAFMQLNQSNKASGGQGHYSREAAVVATEVFCSIAKSGFHDASTPQLQAQSPNID